MPKINVYLPESLAVAVRDAGVPVSAVCQRALADAVAAVDGGLGAEQQGSGGQSEESARLRSRLTQRAEKALAVATEQAAAANRPATSIELIEGLLIEGNNLALAVLRGLDIDPEDLRSELRATESAVRRTSETRQAATLDEVCEAAAQAALLLGHNYIGCEHLLLGVLAGPEHDLATATLRTLGLELDKCRDAVRVALSGINYAQTTLSLSGMSAPVRSILEEIRQRLSRLEQPRS